MRGTERRSDPSQPRLEPEVSRPDQAGLFLDEAELELQEQLAADGRRPIPRVCCRCGAPYEWGRRYTCAACQLAAEELLDQQEATRRRDPHLVGGELRIPFDSPARFRWWDKGQTIIETLQELGAPAWVFLDPTPAGGRLLTKEPS